MHAGKCRQAGMHACRQADRQSDQRTLPQTPRHAITDDELARHKGAVLLPVRSPKLKLDPLPVGACRKTPHGSGRRRSLISKQDPEPALTLDLTV